MERATLARAFDMRGQRCLPESEWPTVIDAVLRRVFSWRIPAHWSRGDWGREMRAQAASAVWQAVCDYDPSRGVPFSAYARQRVLSSALTRYRQEWAYAFRCVLSQRRDGDEWDPPRPPCSSALCESLREALLRLSRHDLWLLEQMFWEDRTESDIAEQVGISQQAISKRKNVILRELRRRIGAVPSPVRQP